MLFRVNLEAILTGDSANGGKTWPLGTLLNPVYSGLPSLLFFIRSLKTSSLGSMSIFVSASGTSCSLSWNLVTFLGGGGSITIFDYAGGGGFGFSLNFGFCFMLYALGSRDACCSKEYVAAAELEL